MRPPRMLVRALMLVLLVTAAFVEASPPLIEAQPGSGAAAFGKAPPSVLRTPGSVRKVCQLTGEVDRQRNTTAPSLTQTRFGLVGTDLGSSFVHAGRLYFLFGDSNPSRDNLPSRPFAGDSIAYTDQLTSRGCDGLRMVAAPDGFYLSPVVPGVSLGSFEIPTGGFSDGQRMYVFLATDSGGEQVMTRSVLARSDDDGRSFTYLYDVSRSKFINVAPVVVSNPAVPGVPAQDGQGVLMWASGAYRRSDPYLAWAPLARVEVRSEWRYFAGVDPDSLQPRWSRFEADAAPLFSHPCIGELSVDWNSFLRVWLMVYNCDEPRGIIFRVAAQPWGPWSPPALLFDPGADGGYCNFIHASWDFVMCDSVHDPGREREWGGEYGPYLVSTFTTGDGRRSTVYFVMSTWNPYTTVLMQATLEPGPGGVPDPPALEVPARELPGLSPGRDTR